MTNQEAYEILTSDYYIAIVDEEYDNEEDEEEES